MPELKGRPTDQLGQIYHEWITEMTRYPDMSLNLLRIIFEDWQRATEEPEGVTYARREFGGVSGLVVNPIGATGPEIMLLLHGGGFALGSSATHRKLAGHFAAATRRSVFVADYRLAPENPYPAPLDDCCAAFEGLVAAGYDPADVIPLGDSAGGNLAIAVTLRRMHDRLPLPRQVVVLSPWLNMENNGATLVTNDATDFLIAPEGLQANIDRYLSGGVSPTDPRVNALYANFSGFPRLFINAGSVESLLDNALQLEARARDAGVDVHLSVGAGMQHVYPLMAGKHAAADQLIEEVAGWLDLKPQTPSHTT